MPTGPMWKDEEQGWTHVPPHRHERTWEDTAFEVAVTVAIIVLCIIQVYR